MHQRRRLRRRACVAAANGRAKVFAGKLCHLAPHLRVQINGVALGKQHRVAKHAVVDSDKLFAHNAQRALSLGKPIAKQVVGEHHLAVGGVFKRHHGKVSLAQIHLVEARANGGLGKERLRVGKMLDGSLNS